MRRFSIVVVFILAGLVLSCGSSPGGGGGIDQPGDSLIPTIPQYESEFEDLFNTAAIKTLHIHISEAEWRGLLNDFTNHENNEIYRQATFYYGEDVGSATKVEKVGFRLRGNTSRKNPSVERTSFKIKFNAQFSKDESVYGSPSQAIAPVPENQGRTFKTMRSINLKYNKGDPTYMKEVFAYDLFRRFGVQAPRAGYAKLYIKIGDDTSKYYGVFAMIENVDKVWIRRRYSVSSYLFKCLYQGEGPADLAETDTDGSHTSGKTGMEIKDPCDEGWSGSPYRPAYDLKAKETEFVQAEAALNSLITLLQGSPTRAELEAVLDVQAFLRAQAVNAYLGGWDDYWRLGNNYYMLYRPTDSKWLFIPYDYDNILGGTTWVGDDAVSSSLTNWGASHNVQVNPVLVEKVLAIPEFRTNYHQYIRLLFAADQQFLRWEVVNTRMQELQSTIAAHTSGYEIGDSYPYSSDLSGFQDFLNNRQLIAEYEVGTTTEAPDADGNTSTATAVSLDYDTEQAASISTSGDKDYFKITISSNSTYRFSLYDCAGDFQLELLNGAGSVFYTANSSGNGDVIISISIFPDTIYMRVTPRAGVGSYKVKWALNPLRVSISGDGSFVATSSYTTWLEAFPMNGGASLLADAQDPGGISKVVFQVYDWDATNYSTLGTDSSAPYSIPLTIYTNDVFYFRVLVTNNSGQGMESTGFYGLAYDTANISPVDNANGTYTFYVHPTNLSPDGTGHNIYLAGEMNGWGNDDYTTQGSYRFTNATAGNGLQCLTTTASSGQQYKLNIDYNNNDLREDTTEWYWDPGNKHIRFDGSSSYNCFIP